jgi:hypothetical protein
VSTKHEQDHIPDIVSAHATKIEIRNSRVAV